ncbi:uncharacterized protein B0I36DRAFT_300682, partial [Microdochium trichocladiopsis]
MMLEKATTLVEPLWVFSTYACVFVFHAFRRSLPIRRKNFNAFRHLTLICHIAIPIAELFSYHFRAINSQPSPTACDLTLCLAHSFTALRLVSRLSAGDKVIARPNYQSIAFLRATLSLIGYARGDKFYYRASIRVINGFVYPRILIKAMSTYKILPTQAAIYTASNFTASIISLHEAQVLFGPHLFVILIGLNIFLNRWVA